MPLGFLPPELTGYATEDELFAAARGVFQSDFMATGAVFDGNPVQINAAISPEGWEESFKHLVTREPFPGAPRVKDSTRAQRVPWAKALINNCLDPQVTYFMYLEGNGYVRHYIWNQADDYVVILESKRGAIHLVTGFVVDLPYKRYDLQKKLLKAIK